MESPGEKRTTDGFWPALLVGLLLFLLLKPRETYAEIQETVNREMNRTLERISAEKPGVRTFMILNAESPEPFKEVSLSDGILFQRLRVHADLVNAMHILDTLSAERLIYAWSNVIRPAGNAGPYTTALPGAG